MKFGLTNPDLIQSVIETKRKKLGIKVTKDKFLPGFNVKSKKYVCIEGEMFIEDAQGDLTQYHS